MAICLEYQAVYERPSASKLLSWKVYGAVYLMILFVVGLEVRDRLEITSLGYELHAVAQVGLELAKEGRDLEYQLSVLTTHDHLRVESQQRLGMEEVLPSQLVVARTRK